MHDDELSIEDEVLEQLNKRLELNLVHAKLRAVEFLHWVLTRSTYSPEEQVMAASALLVTMPAIEVETFTLERIGE
jgi:Iap family predicted aminopeptidase